MAFLLEPAKCQYLQVFSLGASFSLEKGILYFAHVIACLGCQGAGGRGGR